MDNARMDENKTRRHWLSFGIRDLLWAMVVVAVALGWYLEYRYDRRQVALIKATQQFLVPYHRKVGVISGTIEYRDGSVVNVDFFVRDQPATSNTTRP